MILHKTVIAIAVSIALAILSTGQPAPQTRAPLEPAWERAFDGVRGIALSASGNCAAVITTDNLIVVGRDGREQWRWNYRAGNRFITATAVAISPDCNWAAFTGDSGYRYSWIARRNGQRVSLSFQNTPQAIAIDHQGRRLAIGTAGNEIRLYTADGALTWTRSEGDVISEVAFSSDDQSVMVTAWNAAIISVAGKVRWSRALWVGGMQPSRDLKTFVAWTQPPHGPGPARVALLDENGATLWTKLAAFEPQSVITPSGDLSAFRLSDNQNEETALTGQESANHLALVTRAGNVLRTLSGDGIPVAFSADGKTLVINRRERIEAVDLEDHILWTILATESSASLPKVWTTPNVENLLVHEGNRIRWFAPR